MLSENVVGLVEEMGFQPSSEFVLDWWMLSGGRQGGHSRRLVLQRGSSADRAEFWSVAQPCLHVEPSVECLFSSRLTPVPIYIAWWTEAHVCEQLAQCCNVRDAERPGLEPATYWLQVRRPNHYTVTPHNNRSSVLYYSRIDKATKESRTEQLLTCRTAL